MLFDSPADFMTEKGHDDIPARVPSPAATVYNPHHARLLYF